MSPRFVSGSIYPKYQTYFGVNMTNILSGVADLQVNLMGLAMLALVFGLLFLFYRIQKSEKLDFADMITKNGKSVSLTKVLQLVGGVGSTWIMIKLTLTGGLTEGMFGVYLAYVGAIEGYSKFVAAKYNYDEKSVKDNDKTE